VNSRESKALIQELRRLPTQSFEEFADGQTELVLGDHRIVLSLISAAALLTGAILLKIFPPADGLMATIILLPPGVIAAITAGFALSIKRICVTADELKVRSALGAVRSSPLPEVELVTAKIFRPGRSASYSLDLTLTYSKRCRRKPFRCESIKLATGRKILQLFPPEKRDVLMRSDATAARRLRRKRRSEAP